MALRRHRAGILRFGRGRGGDSRRRVRRYVVAAEFGGWRRSVGRWRGHLERRRRPVLHAAHVRAAGRRVRSHGRRLRRCSPMRILPGAVHLRRRWRREQMRWRERLRREDDGGLPDERLRHSRGRLRRVRAVRNVCRSRLLRRRRRLGSVRAAALHRPDLCADRAKGLRSAVRWLRRGRAMRYLHEPGGMRWRPRSARTMRQTAGDGCGRPRVRTEDVRKLPFECLRTPERRLRRSDARLQHVHGTANMWRRGVRRPASAAARSAAAP